MVNCLVVRNNKIFFLNNIDLTKLQEKLDLLIVVSRLSDYEIKFSITNSMRSSICFYNLDIFSLDRKRHYLIEFMFSGMELRKISFIYWSGCKYYYETDEMDDIIEQMDNLIKKL